MRLPTSWLGTLALFALANSMQAQVPYMNLDFETSARGLLWSIRRSVWLSIRVTSMPTQLVPDTAHKCGEVLLSTQLGHAALNLAKSVPRFHRESRNWPNRQGDGTMFPSR